MKKLMLLPLMLCCLWLAGHGNATHAWAADNPLPEEPSECSTIMTCPQAVINVNIHFVGWDIDTDLPTINFEPTYSWVSGSMGGRTNANLLRIRMNEFFAEMKPSETGLQDFIGDTQIRINTYSEPDREEDLYNGVWFWDEIPTDEDLIYKDDVIHLFFLTRGTTCGSSGIAGPPPAPAGQATISYPSCTVYNYQYRNFHYPCTVVDDQGNVYTAPYPNEFWIFAAVMIHEIFHHMGLGHPFTEGSVCTGYEGDLDCTKECATTDDNGFPICGNIGSDCPGMWQGGSTNFMSYTAVSSSISPCQLNRIYQNLPTKSYVDEMLPSSVASFKFEDENQVPKDIFLLDEDVYLNGTDSENEESFLLSISRRIAGELMAFENVIELGPITGTVSTFSLSDLLANQNPAIELEGGYQYDVALTTINGDCLSWTPSSERFTIEGCPVPQNPDCVTENGLAYIRWDAVPESTSYFVEFAPPTGFSGCDCLTPISWSSTINITTPFLTLGFLGANTCFEWRVRSNCSQWSDWQCRKSMEESCEKGCLSVVDFDIPNQICFGDYNDYILTNNSIGYTEVAFNICVAQENNTDVCDTTSPFGPTSTGDWWSADQEPTSYNLYDIYDRISDEEAYLTCGTSDDWGSLDVFKTYIIELKMRNECGEEFSMTQNIEVYCCDLQEPGDGRPENPTAGNTSDGSNPGTDQVLELMNTMPNPFSDKLMLQFLIEKSAPVEIKIYNGIGELSYSYNGSFDKGFNVHEINSLGQSAPGVYTVTIKSEQAQVSERIVKILE